MSLYLELQAVTSEEEVKDLYIAALGLKKVNKNLIDIQTDDIWFEAKHKPKSVYAMFTQLLHTVNVAINKGYRVPPFLMAIDIEKAAIMRTDDILPLFNDRTIKWGPTASKTPFIPEVLEKVSTYIGTHFVTYNIKTDEEELLSAVKLAVRSGKIVRTQITPDNLKQVFDKWVDWVGKEIIGVDEADFASLFFADIMHDGKTSTYANLPAKLLHDGDNPVFVLNNVTCHLGSYDGYRNFWMLYHKPPYKEYRNYLLERRDTLIPNDERKFKGAYYTPLNVVDKAYDVLAKVLGKSWQKNYIVWDMCCGVGNLETKHSHPRNIFMSTLDKGDIEVMQSGRICVEAERFQYDYLNDDVTDDGSIDYSISNKMPVALQKAINDGKKLLVLINPPYAEATNFENIATGVNASNKSDVAKTKIALNAMNGYGKASNELFVQFLARISIEIPTATVAMFSTLKYINAPNFEKFRQSWNAKYLGGFVVHNKAFDGLTGNFPIGFLVWATNQLAKEKTPINEILVEVLNKKAIPIGEKLFYSLPVSSFLNVWLDRPRANKEPVIPLKNALSPTVTTPRVKTWSDDAIAYMYCGVNDPQHTEQQTVVYSSVYGGGNGFYITPDNLWQAAVIFTVRRLIKPTWLNDRDQFLQPTSALSDEFINDCLIWMLFNRCNRTASADDLEWDNRSWSITSHFIPFTEKQVGSPSRFTSYFMVDYLEDKSLSQAAELVMSEGRKLWTAYYSHQYNHKIREELKLHRDVGWYQVRKALETRATSGHPAVNFAPLNQAYDALGDKLREQVYELGFMKM